MVFSVKTETINITMIHSNAMMIYITNIYIYVLYYKRNKEIYIVKKKIKKKNKKDF